MNERKNRECKISRKFKDLIILSIISKRARKRPERDAERKFTKNKAIFCQKNENAKLRNYKKSKKNR